MIYGLSIILTLLLPVEPAYSATPPETGRFAKSAVEANDLEEAIRTGLDKVEEITFLRQEMEKLGLKRGWLFGGTAAAFGHYVNWDLRRRQGDARFQPNRFDYDYTNIFRSTQDLDIVIDGTPEQAEALERRLREVYPHLQGTQSAWEVRLLKQDRGSKEALLNNPNFSNQHTDSNSTGLIEFTQTSPGEPLVGDLRDPDARVPKFFEDIRLGKLKFYYSRLHHTTKRFQKGLNPPIFSVVRYFTKLFQYELQVDPKDKEYLQKIITEFQPSSLTEEQALRWLKKNGKKLFQNAVNLEYAANTLEDYKLRKKLFEFDSAAQLDSLSWWLNRKPLASLPLGQGAGATAASLGITEVAHETTDYLAYESITRSHTGEPNVFTSRTDAEGEAAMLGEGFYTKVGREGARGTGITIRFMLDPAAREGTDFTFDRPSGYIVVHNKKALSVIPESLDLTPRQFFEVLIHNGATWGEHDKSILEKFKRRMKKKLLANPEEMAEIAEKVNEALLQETTNASLLEEWLSLLEKNEKQPRLMEKFLRPLTHSKNSWVSLKANYLLSELKLPSSIEMNKPLKTYFQALQVLGKSWQESDDRHFKQIRDKVDFAIATIEDLKEIFRMISSDLIRENQVNKGWVNRSILLGEWSKLWATVTKKHPLELKAFAREIAENQNLPFTPRYKAMDYLIESLKIEKDPQLIELFFTSLGDKDQPVAYRAIIGLGKYAANDTRTAPALAEYILHTDDSTMQHTLKAFETVKTSDPKIQHKLIQALGSARAYSLNATEALKNNVPADSLSEAELEKIIFRGNPYMSSFAIEILALMPHPTPKRITHLLNALKEKNAERLVLAAAKGLVKYPEHRPTALNAVLNNLREMNDGSSFTDCAEFLIEHNEHLFEVKDRLNAMVATGSGYSWQMRPLIQQIEERLAALQIPHDCSQVYKNLQAP